MHQLGKYTRRLLDFPGPNNTAYRLIMIHSVVHAASPNPSAAPLPFHLHVNCPYE